jgi:hypothetical protein
MQVSTPKATMHALTCIKQQGLTHETVGQLVDLVKTFGEEDGRTLSVACWGLRAMQVFTGTAHLKGEVSKMACSVASAVQQAARRCGTERCEDVACFLDLVKPNPDFESAE